MQTTLSGIDNADITYWHCFPIGAGAPFGQMPVLDKVRKFEFALGPQSRGLSQENSPP